jgi:hypothetical protein
MIEVPSTAADAAGEVAQHLQEPRAWLVVFGDGALAQFADGMAGGPVRRVLLAPDTDAVRAAVASCAGAFDARSRAVAIHPRSGRVVDQLLPGEPMDEVRLLTLFAAMDTP